MEMTLAAAAHLTGKGKSTLLRAVKSGKLSARRTEDGTFMVDASELARVFPVKQAVEQVERTTGAPRSGTEAPDVLDTEREVLRAKLGMLEDTLAREREVARETADTLRETVDDLRRRLDRAEERVQALTYQPQVQPVKTGGFLWRIFGR